MQHSRKAKLSLLYLWVVHVALGVIGFPLLFLLDVEPADRFLFWVLSVSDIHGFTL